MDHLPPDRSVEFTVLGEPHGYVAKAVWQNDRAKEYWAYCEKVRIMAKQAGLALPLHAAEKSPIMVFAVCFFGRRNHFDTENVLKGLKDSLFYHADGGDRFTGSACFPPLYDHKNPRVLVTVEWWNMDKLKKEYGLE